MVLIARDYRVWNGLVTIEVSPAVQPAIARFNWSETQQIIRWLPGFVGSAFFVSTRGTQVIEYVQWHDDAAFTAARSDPGFAEHIPLVEAVDHVRWQPITLTAVEGPAGLKSVVTLHPQLTPAALMGEGQPPDDASWAIRYTDPHGRPGYLAEAPTPVGPITDSIYRLAYVSEPPCPVRPSGR